MDYAEALKQVQSEKKPADNFLIIKMGWGCEFLLPYAEGVTVMNALNHAEQYESPYKKGPSIKPLEKDKLTFSHFSRADYQHAKIAALLGLTSDELTEQLKPPEMAKEEA